MSSSSTRLERPYLPDLQIEVPAPAQGEFCETSEFEQVLRSELPPITPEEAHRNGLREGEELGRAAALKELEPVVEHFHALSRSLAQIHERFLEDAEVEMVRVASQIASRVLHGELQQETDAVVRMARACIQEARPSAAATVYCSPHDLELLRVHMPDLESELAEHSLSLRAEATLERGGIVLESGGQFYDGRPERVLHAALEDLALKEET